MTAICPELCGSTIAKMAAEKSVFDSIPWMQASPFTVLGSSFSVRAACSSAFQFSTASQLSAMAVLRQRRNDSYQIRLLSIAILLRRATAGE
eukprot:SAG31_NODE_28715_length_406_cov_0.674267_1_plen_92_part_00